jgi:DNA-binding phage protein
VSSLEKRLSPHDKAGLRFLNQIAKELSEAYARRAADSDASISDIARLLGCNRSVIYRRLAGDANMTATTIGALAKALSLRPADVLLVDARPAVASNRPPSPEAVWTNVAGSVHLVPSVPVVPRARVRPTTGAEQWTTEAVV